MHAKLNSLVSFALFVTPTFYPAPALADSMWLECSGTTLSITEETGNGGSEQPGSFSNDVYVWDSSMHHLSHYDTNGKQLVNLPDEIIHDDYVDWSDQTNGGEAVRVNWKFSGALWRTTLTFDAVSKTYFTPNNSNSPGSTNETDYHGRCKQIAPLLLTGLRMQ
jgi:hypothetical protein